MHRGFCLNIGIKCKPSGAVSGYQINLNSPEAKPSASSAALQSELPPAISQKTDLGFAAVQTSFSEDDEDADLHIPLAFVKAKAPHSSNNHAGVAPHNRDVDAAFGSNTAEPVAWSQERAPCYQSLASELEQDDDRCYSAMADLGSQPTTTAK